MKLSTLSIGKYVVGCLGISAMLLAAACASAPAAAQQTAAPSTPASASQQAQSGPPADGSQSSGQNAQTGAAPAVGTAAAPYEKPMGVTASRPAGAVIAPAKQRRVRSILIKIGIVVGAGVAIGTVAALSHASPSQPH